MRATSGKPLALTHPGCLLCPSHGLGPLLCRLHRPCADCPTAPSKQAAEGMLSHNKSSLLRLLVQILNISPGDKESKGVISLPSSRFSSLIWRVIYS